MASNKDASTKEAGAAADSTDLDSSWDEPAPPSRVPVSPVRGGTLRFGEKRRSQASAQGSDAAASAVRGGTLRWGELVALVKRELAAPVDKPSGGRSWDELTTVARALGVEGVPDQIEDELDALAVDQLLETLAATAALEGRGAEPAPTDARPRASSRPEIIIDGEVDLPQALREVSDGDADAD